MSRAPLAFAAAVLGRPLVAGAEVATDGTLRRRVRLAGPDVEVGAELGQVRGRNLFHSFERFGVGAGGRVTFTGPGGLDNVVSRVTGGEASRIDGALASEVAGADLYLVNPAGVVFGPGGRLDVPGSFHASTADEVRLADGTSFSARGPSGGTLSVARPEAFGFLGGGRPAAIEVDESILTVPTGEALSLVGGDVTVVGGPEGFVAAEARRVTIGALAGAGTARVDTGETTGAGGHVRLTDRALVSVSGNGGVTVEVGTAIIGSSSRLETGALAAGDAGAVAVRADDLQLRDGGQIGSGTFGEGAAGGVSVEAGRLLVSGDGSIFFTGVSSVANRNSTGDAGKVVVRADDLQIRDGGSITSSGLGVGRAGEVRVRAGTLLVEDAAILTRGAGAEGGRVEVAADDLALLDGAEVTSNGVRADPGSSLITLRAPLIALLDGSGVTSLTGDGTPIRGSRQHGRRRPPSLCRRLPRRRRPPRSGLRCQPRRPVFHLRPGRPRRSTSIARSPNRLDRHSLVEPCSATKRDAPRRVRRLRACSG